MDFRPAENDFVIAADAGLRYLEQAGILADLVIGDFDTLKEIPTGANVVRLNCEKDDTDMLAAVREGIKAGYKEFHIYGGTGGRIDHTSPTAFTRAFKGFHGIVPSALKTENSHIQAFPPIRFHVSVDGGQPLKFRVEDKAAFRVVGLSCPLDKEINKNFEVIPTVWDTALADGALAKLNALQEGIPQGVLGISIHHTEDWKYLIAVRSDKKDDTFEEYWIPACKWAVFEGQGTNRSLQELEKRVIVEWLPTSGFTYANSPDIEVYIKADPREAVYEYWIPIL